MYNTIRKRLSSLALAVAAFLGLGTGACGAFEICPPAKVSDAGGLVSLTDAYFTAQTADGVRTDLTFEGLKDRKVWRLVQRDGIRIRAACDYEGEIFGQPIDARFSRCELLRSTRQDGATESALRCD